MPKTDASIEAINLARMERCREIARDLGFRAQGRRGSLVHSSELAEIHGMLR